MVFGSVLYNCHHVDYWSNCSLTRQTTDIVVITCLCLSNMTIEILWLGSCLRTLITAQNERRKIGNHTHTYTHAIISKHTHTHTHKHNGIQSTWQNSIYQRQPVNKALPVCHSAYRLCNITCSEWYRHKLCMKRSLLLIISKSSDELSVTWQIKLTLAPDTLNIWETIVLSCSLSTFYSFNEWMRISTTCTRVRLICRTAVIEHGYSPKRQKFRQTD